MKEILENSPEKYYKLKASFFLYICIYVKNYSMDFSTVFINRLAESQGSFLIIICLYVLEQLTEDVIRGKRVSICAYCRDGTAKSISVKFGQ